MPEQLDAFIIKAKEILATREPVTYEITQSRIEVLAPTVANHHFIYNRKMVLADDMTFESPVACTWTYLLEGDVWKIRNAHISYPKEQFRAGEGQNAFFAFLDVKADMKEEFEQMMHDMIFDKAAEADHQAEFIAGKSRILHPFKENDEGTLTYLVMIDPMYEGNYNFTTGNLLRKIYGEEKGKELSDRFDATLAGPQKSYFMTQSRH